MSLDRLSNQCDYSHGPTTAEEKSEDSFSPHVINDSDQEASDIECNYEESEASGSIDDTYEPGESETDTSVNSIAKLSDTHPVNIERKMDDTFCNTYKPLEGEDIYGRNKEDVPEAKAAYVPPGKRIVLDEVKVNCDNLHFSLRIFAISELYEHCGTKKAN